MKLRHQDVILAREIAHGVFDLLWKLEFMTKEKAYAWMASFFDHMPKKEAHIGRLSIEQCLRLEEACREKLATELHSLREQVRCIPKPSTPKGTAKQMKLKDINELQLGALRRIAMEDIGTLPDGTRPTRRFLAQEALENRVPILHRRIK